MRKYIVQIEYNLYNSCTNIQGEKIHREKIIGTFFILHIYTLLRNVITSTTNAIRDKLYGDEIVLQAHLQCPRIVDLWSYVEQFLSRIKGI